MQRTEVGRTSAGVLPVIGHIGRLPATILVSYISTGRRTGAEQTPGRLPGA